MKMSMALQVFVRGFETQTAGERIVKVLKNYGFSILECFDGESDDGGGVIETNICEAAFLDNDGDLQPLRETVFAVAPPGTFIQYRSYMEDDEGEFHAPSVDVHENKDQ